MGEQFGQADAKLAVPTDKSRGFEQSALALLDDARNKSPQAPERQRSAQSLENEIQGLKLAFPSFGQGMIATQKDGVLSKADLTNKDNEPLNEPYRSYHKELLKRFDEMAPSGELTHKDAKTRIKQLQKMLDETPEEIARKKELAEQPAREERMFKAADKFVHEHGTNPAETISDALRKNSVVFVSSPALDVLDKLTPSLKEHRGACLAMTELPSSLAPAFENGKDFATANVANGPYAKEATEYLHNVVQQQPELKRVLHAVQDAGVKVVPVGDDKTILKGTDVFSTEGAETRNVEAMLANRLAHLQKEHGKLLVLGDSTHGAIHYDGETPLLPVMVLSDNGSQPDKVGATAENALPDGKVKPLQTAMYQLAHTPALKDKVVSIATAADTGIPAPATDASGLTTNNDRLRCVPVSEAGKPTAVAPMTLLGQPVSSYDYLIIHPAKK